MPHKLSINRSPLLEPPSPILTLGVNLSRTYLFLELISSPVIAFRSVLLRKRCDLQNNKGEKRGGEFVRHAVYRRNNVFVGNVFLKIKRYGKGLTQGYSADGGFR